MHWKLANCRWRSDCDRRFHAEMSWIRWVDDGPAAERQPWPVSGKIHPEIQRWMGWRWCWAIENITYLESHAKTNICTHRQLTIEAIHGGDVQNYDRYIYDGREEGKQTWWESCVEHVQTETATQFTHTIADYCREFTEQTFGRQLDVHAQPSVICFYSVAVETGRRGSTLCDQSMQSHGVFIQKKRHRNSMYRMSLIDSCNWQAMDVCVAWLWWHCPHVTTVTPSMSL